MNKLSGKAHAEPTPGLSRFLVAVQRACHRNPRRPLRRLIVAAALVMTVDAAAAPSFKCIGADGHITYQQAPCSGAGSAIDVHDNQVGGGIRPSEAEWMNAREQAEREVDAAHAARAAEVQHELDRKALEDQRAEQDCRDAKRRRDELNYRAETFEDPKIRRYYRNGAQSADDYVVHHCVGRY